jgi:hypothetical protein
MLEKLCSKFFAREVLPTPMLPETTLFSSHFQGPLLLQSVCHFINLFEIYNNIYIFYKMFQLNLGISLSNEMVEKTYS